MNSPGRAFFAFFASFAVRCLAPPIVSGRGHRRMIAEREKRIRELEADLHAGIEQAALEHRYLIELADKLHEADLMDCHKRILAQAHAVNEFIFATPIWLTLARLYDARPAAKDATKETTRCI